MPPLGAPGARQKRSKARCRCSGVMPGPSSVTCRSTQHGLASRSARLAGTYSRSSMVTVLSAGEARRALESRLSRICSTAPGTASTGPTLPANRTRATPSRSNNGSQVPCRSTQTAPTSTGPGVAASSSRRAIASRPSTILASRSVSVTAAARLPWPGPHTSGSRFSRRSRSAASGVFSWCEASPANACWEASRKRQTGTGAVTSPSANAWVARSSSRMGRPAQRARARQTTETAVSTPSPPAPSSSQARSIRSRAAWVGTMSQTAPPAPSATGAVTDRCSAPPTTAMRTSLVAEPFSAAAIPGRAGRARAARRDTGCEAASTPPELSTITTFPPTRSAQWAARSVRSSPARPVARDSAV